MTDSNLQNNAVVASSASQWVSIVPSNGEQFNPKQKIIYDIEPELGYIKKDSYLVFDILNNSANQDRWTLQKNLGAHAVIDRVDIYSKETGILLESLTNYSQWVNIEHQYLFDDHSNLQNQQGVGHPVQSWTYERVGDDINNGLKKKHSLAQVNHIENNQLSPLSADGTNGGTACYTSRRFCIPLKCGVFGHFDAVEKAIPVMNFGGLRVEITLATPERALQRLCAVIKDNTGFHEDYFHPLDYTAGVPLRVDATDQSATVATTFKVQIGSTDATDGWRNKLQDSGLIVGNAIALSNMTQTDDSVYRGGAVSGVVESMTLVTDKAVVLDGVSTVLKQYIEIVVGGVANGAGCVGMKTGTIKVVNAPNYKITNTEFRLLQIVPPPNVADSLVKGINYEFTSYEVFLDNIPTAPLRHQIPIHSIASKAVSTFTQIYGTDNDEGQQKSASDYYAGSLPRDIKLNDVVYFINNRLYPLRSYNPQALADKVLSQNELVKAFRAIGKQPLSLGNADFSDLEGYTNTPLISRELARSGMVFDLRNSEPELRVAFSGTRGSVLRANTFVFSKKIIQTTATGVQVIH